MKYLEDREMRIVVVTLLFVGLCAVGIALYPVIKNVMNDTHYIDVKGSPMIPESLQWDPKRMEPPSWDFGGKK